MSRSVKPWVGKNDDSPVPERVLERLLKKQDWRCKCGLSLRDQAFDRYHITALINWVPTPEEPHGNREGNLQLLGVKCCHRPKTREDMKIRHRTSRSVRHHSGIKKSRTPIPGGKNSRLKRRMDGTVIDRATGEVVSGRRRA